VQVNVGLVLDGMGKVGLGPGGIDYVGPCLGQWFGG
jgi:hypothetical protein